jgi:hypothetical protein
MLPRRLQPARGAQRVGAAQHSQFQKSPGTRQVWPPRAARQRRWSALALDQLGSRLAGRQELRGAPRLPAPPLTSPASIEPPAARAPARLEPWRVWQAASASARPRAAAAWPAGCAEPAARVPLWPFPATGRATTALKIASRPSTRFLPPRLRPTLPCAAATRAVGGSVVWHSRPVCARTRATRRGVRARGAAARAAGRAPCPPPERHCQLPGPCAILTPRARISSPMGWHLACGVPPTPHTHLRTRPSGWALPPGGALLMPPRCRSSPQKGSKTLQAFGQARARVRVAASCPHAWEARHGPAPSPAVSPGQGRAKAACRSAACCRHSLSAVSPTERSALCI